MNKTFYLFTKSRYLLQFTSSPCVGHSVSCDFKTYNFITVSQTHLFLGYSALLRSYDPDKLLVIQQ